MLQGLGFSTATAEWTGYDSDQVMDGQQIHEAIIDPRKATIEVTHNGTVAQRQTTSSVAAALGALVAANAGFFITSSSFGFGFDDGVVHSMRKSYPSRHNRNIRPLWSSRSSSGQGLGGD